MDPLSPSARLLAALARIQQEDGTVVGTTPTSQTKSESGSSAAAAANKTDLGIGLSSRQLSANNPILRHRTAGRSQSSLTSPSSGGQQSDYDDSFSAANSSFDQSSTTPSAANVSASPTTTSSNIRAQHQLQQQQLQAEKERLSKQQQQLAAAQTQSYARSISSPSTQPSSTNLSKSTHHSPSPSFSGGSSSLHRPSSSWASTSPDEMLSQLSGASNTREQRALSPPRTSPTTSGVNGSPITFAPKVHKSLLPTGISNGSTSSTNSSNSTGSASSLSNPISAGRSSSASHNSSQSLSISNSLTQPRPRSPQHSRSSSQLPLGSSILAPTLPSLIPRKILLTENGLNWTEDHIKLLDLISRYTANSYSTSSPSSSWLRHLPLLVLIYEGINTKPAPIFTFDFAPVMTENINVAGRDGIESKNLWLNIAQEALSFLHDLQSAQLIISVRVTNNNGTSSSLVSTQVDAAHSIGYQVTERGRELLRDMQVRGIAGFGQVTGAIDRLLTHNSSKNRFNVTFDGATFQLSNGSFTRTSTISEVEPLSFALAPYLPLSNLWHAKAAHRFTARGWSTERRNELATFNQMGRPLGLKAAMYEHAKLGDVAILTSEWVPMGENSLSKLNQRLGAQEKRIRNRPVHLVSTLHSSSSDANMVLELPHGLGDTQLHVIDFDLYHYCALQVTSDLSMSERGSVIARQLASFATSTHANGILSFGAYIDQVAGQTNDVISLDALARISAAFQTRCNSVAATQLLNQPQKHMLEALYGGELNQPTINPSKPLLIFASSITPSAPAGVSANFYREQETIENELKSLLGPIQKCVNLDAHDEVLILGQQGILVLGPRGRRHEESLHTWLNFQSRSNVLEQFSIRSAQLSNILNKTLTQVEGLMRNGMEGGSQHLIPGLKTMIRLQLEEPIEALESCLDYLRESIELLGNVSDTSNSLGGEDRGATKLRKVLSLEAFARSLKRRCKDIAQRVMPTLTKGLARLMKAMSELEATHTFLLQESIEHQVGELTPLNQAQAKHSVYLGVIQILMGLGLSIMILDRFTGEWSLVTETSFESLIGEPYKNFTALDDVSFILFNLLILSGIIYFMYHLITRFILSRSENNKPYVLRLMKLNRKVIDMEALETLLHQKNAIEDGYELVMNTTIRKVHWDELNNDKPDSASGLGWVGFSHPPQRIELNLDPKDEYLLHVIFTWDRTPAFMISTKHNGDGQAKANSVNEIESLKNHFFNRLVTLKVLAPLANIEIPSLNFSQMQLVPATTGSRAITTTNAAAKSKPTPFLSASSSTPEKPAAKKLVEESKPAVEEKSSSSVDKTPVKKEAKDEPAAAAASTATNPPSTVKKVSPTPLSLEETKESPPAALSSTSSASSSTNRHRALSLAVSAFSPKARSNEPPSPPPIYNENGVELQQPITINPRTGKPRIKKRFARRYASLILNHIAKENAAAATREALEYRARKKEVLERSGDILHLHQNSSSKLQKLNAHKVHGRKVSVTDYFTSLLHPTNEEEIENELLKEAEEEEEALKKVLGEDPTQKGLAHNSKRSDNSSQIETLHKSGNIFNAILKADRKQVDALLRANPHVLSQRGPVGELPLHMCFLYNTPAHHVLAFYLMSRCPHVIAEPYLGTEYTGENILHIAIIQQDPRMVEMLVKKEPALLNARATGHFFTRGQPCYYGEYPLYFACCTGQKEIVSFLIESGADMEVVDSNGNNALHLMVLHSRPEMYTFVKSKWIEFNDAKPDGERSAGERVLWKRRNAEGFTPMTLSAKMGNFEMFSFLLEEEKQMQWAYGPISCFVYPLEQIDMPLALSSEKAQANAKKLIGADADDDDDVEHPRALELIVNEAHLDLLMHPRMIELIKQKWERFASRIFFQRFMVVLIYLFLFTATTIHRQTENIEGIEKWATFEEHLMIYKNQTAWIEHLTIERQEIMEEVEIKAQEVLEDRWKEYNVLALKVQAMKNKAKDGNGKGKELPVLIEPDLASIKADLLRNLSLPAIPQLNVVPDLDLPHLEALLSKENEKAASRESAGIAKRKRFEEDLEDGALGSGIQWDISKMSTDELRELLTPPDMLYDDGILGGLTDMIGEVITHPPADWAEIVWKYPCILFIGELIVVGGALHKGHNELGELSDRGINNYFGAAGSAFFENTLSLTFSSLMFVVLILSLSGSYLVRMFMGLCSMVGWSYIFFFLLAFRMTGPMIVMIYQMLTSDVIRFLTVFSVFLVAFAQAFYVLFDHDGFSGFITSIQTCFLAMLGDFVFDDYTNSPFKMISVGLLITYVVVVTILLLNLLIAMMGDTYGHVNEHAEMQWHLERARIIFAIEHEMGEAERGKRSNKYWTVLEGKRYLQVMVENSSHFKKLKAPEKGEKDKEE